MLENENLPLWLLESRNYFFFVFMKMTRNSVLIPNKGGKFCQPFTTGNPKFFHLPASLKNNSLELFTSFTFHIRLNIFPCFEISCLFGIIFYNCFRLSTNTDCLFFIVILILINEFIQIIKRFVNIMNKLGTKKPITSSSHVFTNPESTKHDVFT